MPAGVRGDLAHKAGIGANHGTADVILKPRRTPLYRSAPPARRKVPQEDNQPHFSQDQTSLLLSCLDLRFNAWFSLTTSPFPSSSSASVRAAHSVLFSAFLSVHLFAVLIVLIAVLIFLALLVVVLVRQLGSVSG